jgi:glucose/arabinose dehydrogenase
MIHRSRTPWLAMLMLIAVLGVAVGCASGEAAPEPAGAGDQTSAQAGSFRLSRVRGGLGDAVGVVHAPRQANRLYIVQQSGTIRILQRGRLVGTPFLDISDDVTSGGEQGLLGLAFHPDYVRNGRFYVYHTNSSGDQQQVVEYRRGANGRANPGSARVLLSMDDSMSNHNGGHLVFGPDGFLYIGTGDGGGGGDPDDNAQNRDSLLGKILRIDVDSRAPGKQYGIPADNPFAGGGGAPEVYSYGLRNPWAFSFDRVRGDIWIGDVGQGEIEEVDFRRRGGARGVNFGWNAFEGRSPFEDGGPVQGRAPVRPMAQYTHANGCSITGGYVYRGTRVPALRGRYVFADFCDGNLWTMRAGPNPGAKRDDTGRLGVTLSNVTAFGEGLNGELYVLANGSLYRFVRR